MDTIIEVKVCDSHGQVHVCRSEIPHDLLVKHRVPRLSRNALMDDNLGESIPVEVVMLRRKYFAEQLARRIRKHVMDALNTPGIPSGPGRPLGGKRGVPT